MSLKKTISNHYLELTLTVVHTTFVTPNTVTIKYYDSHLHLNIR